MNANPPRKSRNLTPAANGYRGDAARWQAVSARDERADGHFVYAVRTTGVYCRPSCPSRAAKHENVRFFAATKDAERAGFRPCKRCRPDIADYAGARDAERIAKACRLIAASDEMPTLAQLAHASDLSPFHFHRVFKSVTGLTPKAYTAAHRNGRLREGLPRAQSVTAAMYDAGFGSSAAFYGKGKAMLGMAPKTFRDGGARETIRFSVGQCSLGAILVAATGKGICAITLGDDPDVLLKDLQDRFTAADLVGGDAAFDRTTARVIAYVDDTRSRFDLPLDVRGSAFQHRVWDALRKIPHGATRSYSDVAAAIGKPQAVRAVASACAANPVAIVVPCHRVVRTDGSLSGYRWGLARKRTLLDREAAGGQTRNPNMKAASKG